MTISVGCVWWWWCCKGVAGRSGLGWGGVRLLTCAGFPGLEGDCNVGIVVGMPLILVNACCKIEDVARGRVACRKVAGEGEGVEAGFRFLADGGREALFAAAQTCGECKQALVRPGWKVEGPILAPGSAAGRRRRSTSHDGSSLGRVQALTGHCSIDQLLILVNTRFVQQLASARRMCWYALPSWGTATGLQCSGECSRVEEQTRYGHQGCDPTLSLSPSKRQQ